MFYMIIYTSRCFGTYTNNVAVTIILSSSLVSLIIYNATFCCLVYENNSFGEKVI